jgi:hypothetical protein
MAFRGGLSIPDSLRAEASLRVNDLPDAIRDRYPRVEHDRMLYSDAASPEPAIRDLGDHLSGSRYDPRVARDLVAIAEHRGWSQVELWGGPGYQRQLWYEARLAGLKVVGYTPTPAELVELENRQRRAVQRGARPADGPDFDLTAGSAPRTRQVARTDEPTPRPTPTPQAPADPSATGQRRDLWVRTPGDEDPASGAVAVNLLSPGGAVRSVAVGDVPARLTRRYFLDPGNGPGMGFYADAKAPSATFRDHGKHLSTERSDPNVVRDLVDIAAHRGWSAIQVRGQSDPASAQQTQVPWPRASISSKPSSASESPTRPTRPASLQAPAPASQTGYSWARDVSGRVRTAK